MRKLLNVLYVTAPSAYLSLDGENIVLLHDEETLCRVPLHNLEGIVSFGYRGVSPALMGACVERGISLCFLTPHGRFLARVSGTESGNVLLRTRQYQVSSDTLSALALARWFLIGKIYNARWVLERAKRDYALRIDTERLSDHIGQMKTVLHQLSDAASVGELMGLEGSAAKAYFAAFPQLILRNEKFFQFGGRSRRPPLDPVNAMLSFTYTLLGNEIAGALETVGLDPSVGFLHSLRPGRKSLALDLLE